MMSGAIDMKENTYVVVSDIPRAFLHADMEEQVHMLLEGTISALIIKLDWKLYRKYIRRTKSDKPMICVIFMGQYKWCYCFGGYC